MNKIVCLGAIVVDLILSPIDSLPTLGNLKTIEKVSWNTGGCALNCSTNLTKMGIETTLIGAIGDDILGNWIVKKCINNGVDTKNIVIKNKYTSFSVVNVSSSGERSILHYLGTNEYLNIEDINFDIFNDAEYLYIGGVYGLSTLDKQIKDVAHKAKLSNPNLKILLDVIYDDNINDDSLIEDSFKFIDFFIPNYNEAKKMSGKSNLEEISAYFLNKGIKNVIITLGKDGIFFANKENSYEIEGRKIKAIDVTGAGDAFASGLLGALVNGYELKKAVEIGNNIAAISTTVVGASEGIVEFDKLILL
ncbi:carbohydrate kinase family protein [Sporanaerobacter acetigenes]|uniref:Sugar or nucleoside kinase, ribokinase family n=1 Tax=Sporanaerobacter acetigenes DSM 13106 TaxID=1123281 RepID=A0A1M5Z964_9FIRM|nr:carbohydrate kinase family protein [Sporanaerobacter acetigenes]SHI20658.1 Sugar or nucleoside kinase, ribokinase family [Sporanaerobacter acetigenes DSM 13106]